MISIEFIEPQEPNKPQPPAFWQASVRRRFQGWIAEYSPDAVSRMVLTLLIEKYVAGDEAAIFGKMKQLVRDEHYSLCGMFKSLFDYLGINDDYLSWAENDA
jgi:hypothetical protein